MQGTRRAYVLTVLLGCVVVSGQTHAAPTGNLAVFKLRPDQKDGQDWKARADYLTVRVRERVLSGLPQVHVFTDDNLLVLLEANGKKLEDCEGECEVETGRRIGADLIVSGTITRMDQSYRLALQLHETQSGQLLGSVVSAGKNSEELDAALPAAVQQLVGSVPEKFTGGTSIRRKVGYGSVGAAVLVAGAAGILAWQTQVASDEWASAKDYPTWSSARNRTNTLGNVTTVAWVAAGVLAVAGGLLIFTTNY